MHTLTLKRSAGAGLAAVLMAGAAPAVSHAATVDLGGGATTLKLTPKAAKALDGLGVAVSPTKPAKAGKAGIAFPVTGGRIDPATAAGTIRHSGGLRLKAGRTTVRLSDFNVNTVNKGVTAKVNGGKRLKAFVVVLGKARISRDGLGTVVRNVDVHLSTPGANALNKAFGTRALKGRLKLATAVVKTTPSQVAFEGGATSLALDPGAASALQSLGVTPGVAGPATANADGSLSFPITGGKVNAKTLAGSITHSGGITLTKDATTVTLADFTIDTKASQLTATINGGARAAILDLDLANPQVAIDGRTVTVSGVPGTLTQGAADALNQAFGTTAFAAGLKLGTATVSGEAA